jgi:hypothetical protein
MSTKASGFWLLASAAAGTTRHPTSDLRPLLVALLCLLSLLGGRSWAAAQMPDMKQMSGIPRPVDDLPNGSVSVRVIRGDMSKNLANQPVELQTSGDTRTVNTDAEGRAQFDGLPAGMQVRFSAVVDGERLESQVFPMPAQGGVRLLLVATDAEAEKQAVADAISGDVVIGGESRIILEPGDENVLVYYVLDVVNNAQVPVNPRTPIAFSLQSSAVGTAVIQGSSPLASNNGRDVTIRGPFPPGSTQVQIAAEYPISGGTVEITQAFPAAMQEVLVIAKKVGAMQLASPQLARVQETVSEGTPVILGAGTTLAPGTPLTLTVTGLPHHSGVPRTIALVLAVVIVLGGVWALRGPAEQSDRQAERRRLLARREKLFQDLVRLEQDHRRGRVGSAQYATRREELLQALEHVYGALDDEEMGPEPANRPGIAA